MKQLLDLSRGRYAELISAAETLLELQKATGAYTPDIHTMLHKQACDALQEAIEQSRQVLLIRTRKPLVYLPDNWELRGEPNTKEGITSLVEVMMAEDEEGKGLLDNFTDEEEREVQELLNCVSVWLENDRYTDSTRIALDFHKLVTLIARFARPGWCVAMTLSDNGRIGYGHRPMSTDEIITHLMVNEDPSRALRQIADFLDLHENAEVFRNFFFGPASVPTKK